MVLKLTWPDVIKMFDMVTGMYRSVPKMNLFDKLQQKVTVL